MSVALPSHSELAYVRQQRLDIADEQLGRVVRIGGKLPDLLVDAERPDAHLNLGPLVVRRRRAGRVASGFMMLAWPTKIVTAKIEVLARDSGTSQ